MRSLLVVLGAFLILAGPARAASLARTPDAYPWMVDGSVPAMAKSGDTLYLGGEFTYLGPRTGPLALLDPAGAPDPSSPRLGSGCVSAVAADGAGGTFGRLTYAAAGDTLYLSGTFAEIGPGNWRDLHARDGTTGEARSAPQTWGHTEVLVDGSTLYVAARMHLNGDHRDEIAGFDLDGDGALLFHRPMAGASRVRAFSVDAGRIVVGGSFESAGGAVRDRAAAVDLRIGQALPFDPAADAPVRALALAGGELIARGDFTSVDGSPRKRLAGFDAAGAPTGFDPAVDDGSVRALTVDGAIVYAARSPRSPAQAAAVPRRSTAAGRCRPATRTCWAPQVTGARCARSPPLTARCMPASRPSSTSTEPCTRWWPTALRSSGAAPSPGSAGRCRPYGASRR